MKAFLPLVWALAVTSAVYADTLSNFSEPNMAKLQHALQAKTANIIQLGDSHTAADLMTGSLRDRLQQQLGNGGMGWGMPMYFTGQRLSLYGYDNMGWQAVSSRTEHNANYSLGGLLAVPKTMGATLTIKAKQPESEQYIMVSIRQGASDAPLAITDAMGKQMAIEAPIKNNTWQFAQFNATLPFTVTAHSATDTAIAGWWAKNANGQGVVVSALGINGSELSQWDRWNTTAWQQELKHIAPDLVILAYGTNEAYNDHLDVAQTKQVLIERIQQIRQASPSTAILIVSAPESLKSTAGECGIRPINLTAVQEMQKQVAQTEHTLFWSWQQAMGGQCSMKKWIAQGLGRGDGVHFTASGYQQLGQALATDILNFASISRINTTTTTAVKAVPNVAGKMSIAWSSDE
ncbi:SGNH/GDSL hydrolase family protein [Acinetobacter rathckeae]|uniref:SGNH/GDSL hydrolase family protein n=1 Tax=Acinetobacter rathckeae TaxID=2605272 RepID=UPI0018A320AC|nr:SGNH/GDSL hydrolase family protein [Acinetobacter rathckeae]MBF7695367.1 SGNH/GDSL hydrolase family protein [Acinetobacter rathckeae]